MICIDTMRQCVTFQERLIWALGTSQMPALQHHTRIDSPAQANQFRPHQHSESPKIGWSGLPGNTSIPTSHKDRIPSQTKKLHAAPTARVPDPSISLFQRLSLFCSADRQSGHNFITAGVYISPVMVVLCRSRSASLHPSQCHPRRLDMSQGMRFLL